MCLGEADAEIASTARAGGAFVVALDSDFFVFDLPGYLPLSSIDVSSPDAISFTFHGRFALARGAAWFFFVME